LGFAGEPVEVAGELDALLSVELQAIEVNTKATIAIEIRKRID